MVFAHPAIATGKTRIAMQNVERMECLRGWVWNMRFKGRVIEYGAMNFVRPPG